MKDVTRKISSKSELYEANVRNGYFLPHIKSSIITEDYIHAVIKGDILCAKYHDIKLKPCPVPPDKQTLVQIVQDALAENHAKPLGIDASHVPDKFWLLAMLATFDPENEIFAKSYVPPTRKERKEAKDKV